MLTSYLNKAKKVSVRFPEIVSRETHVSLETHVSQETRTSSEPQASLETRCIKKPIIKVKLLCNWCTSEQLAKTWNRQSKGDFTWNNIRLVWNEPSENIDYYVVINSTTESFYPPKTILMRMEPHMSTNKMWGYWQNPLSCNFFAALKHEEGCYNNNEWHLSLDYNTLSNMVIHKSKVMSSIVSEKYNDPGHIKRIDFLKYLEKVNLEFDLYGAGNKWKFSNYKKALPDHCKDEGILPYKYTFNAENFSINDYYTEKIIDGILGECLVFYWGCPNLDKYIDSRAYVRLSLSNFENDMRLIETAIREDWHSQRLPFIKAAKHKILNELQFFPRIEKLIA